MPGIPRELARRLRLGPQKPSLRVAFSYRENVTFRAGGQEVSAGDRCLSGDLACSSGAAATKLGVAIVRGPYRLVRARASAAIRRRVAVVIRERANCRLSI